MAVLGVVAAANSAAGETGPKVNPGVTAGDALVTDAGGGLGLLLQSSPVITPGVI
jgi:hypothetical protein